MSEFCSFGNAYEELAKLRAERDALTREIERVRFDLSNSAADAAAYRLEVARTVGRYFSAEGHGESPACDEDVIDGIRRLTFFESQCIEAQTERDAALARVAELESFAEECRDNWDCDSDAHRYGTGCRACMAEKVLPKENP